MRYSPLTENSNGCVSVPKVPVACNITGSTEINHGTLSPTQINGAEASVTATLQCGAPATLKLVMLPAVIDLGGSISSTLTVNGVADGGTLTTSGTTSLRMLSRLTGSGATPGEHSGSTMLRLDVQ